MEPSVVASSEPGHAVGAPWGRARLVGFRFLFCFLVIANAPFPLGVLPWTETAVEPWDWLFEVSATWLAEHVLGLGAIAVEFNGSGDRTFDYIATAEVIALAIAAAAIWSLVQRRARNHERLLQWLRLYVRFVLAWTMVTYGLAKVFVGQFPVPSDAQLARTYGESSPMNLLWTFMGASRPYSIAAGLMEVAGGVLLFWRRTVIVGALVLIGVLGNVVLLNFCYDVPVKLYSSRLWLTSLFLAWPALPGLVAVLITGRPVVPWRDPPLFAAVRPRRVAAAVQVALAAWLVVSQLHAQWPEPVDPLQGAFDVDQMTLDGRTVALGEDSPRWTRVTFQRQKMRVELGDHRLEVYRSTDAISSPGTLDLRFPIESDRTRRGLLDVRPDPTGLVLEGSVGGKRIRAHLAPVRTGESLLLGRGFHWINEFPFNR
jgi:uncharacterized membrane protein YphA (DoxX/SURF4 family)